MKVPTAFLQLRRALGASKPVGLHVNLLSIRYERAAKSRLERPLVPKAKTFPALSGIETRAQQNIRQLELEIVTAIEAEPHSFLPPQPRCLSLYVHTCRHSYLLRISRFCEATTARSNENEALEARADQRHCRLPPSGLRPTPRTRAPMARSKLPQLPTMTSFRPTGSMDDSWCCHTCG